MWQEEIMRHLTPPMFPGLHISKISAFRKIYYYCFSDFHWPGIIDLQLKGRNKRPFHPQGTPASSSQGVASTQYPWSGAPGQWPPAAYQGCPQEPVIFLALLLPPPPPPPKDQEQTTEQQSESLSVEDQHLLSFPQSPVTFTLDKSLNGNPSWEYMFCFAPTSYSYPPGTSPAPS